MTIASKIVSAWTFTKLKAASFIAAAKAAIAGVFEPFDVEDTLAFRKVSNRKSRRVPNSKAAYRAANGIPHGVPGAKLARKALAGKVGK